MDSIREVVIVTKVTGLWKLVLLTVLWRFKSKKHTISVNILERVGVAPKSHNMLGGN